MTGRGERTLHGTCVAYGGIAALLRGASGAGKSDLALRFLVMFADPHSDRGAALVADDRTRVARRGGVVVVRAPGTIAGLLEVRGVGIVEVPRRREAELRLLVDLVAPAEVPRLPPKPPELERVAGIDLPVVKLAPFEAAAPIKLKLALAGAL